MQGSAHGAASSLGTALLPYLHGGWKLKRKCACMRSGEDWLVGKGETSGRVAKHIPCRPHLLWTEPYYCTTLLLEERPTPEGLQHFSPEGKHVHIPEEREGFLFSCSGIQGITSHWPCCLSSIITVNQWHTRAWVPAASLAGTRETLRHEQLLVPAESQAWWQRGEAARGRSHGKDASCLSPPSGLTLWLKGQHQQPGSKTA